MTKPSLGRALHFFPATSDPLFHSGEPLSATIVRVWSDTCVNLAVLAEDATLHARTSVLLHQAGHDCPEAGYAIWPPREGVQLPAQIDTSAPVAALPPITDDGAEQLIQASGADVAPRVTPAEIDALCADLTIRTHHFPGTTAIVAAAVLPDGFVVATGYSACISPANFKAEIGERIAGDNARAAARSKLWELEGYVLRASIRDPEAAFAGGIMAATS